MMLTLELKWHDEAGWRPVRELKLDENPEHAVENAAEEQKTIRAKRVNVPECSFRVVKVIA